ncbi:hypothetical protein ACQJ9P_07700 [Helicobacter pylori]
MVERLAFQLGFLGQRPKQTKANELSDKPFRVSSLQTTNPISKLIPTNRQGVKFASGKPLDAQGGKPPCDKGQAP